MSFVGNFPHIQMGKEPKSRTQHDNTKKNQGTTTAKKEDNTDSTTTKTTETFTSNCELDWDDYMDDGMTEAILGGVMIQFRRIQIFLIIITW